MPLTNKLDEKVEEAVARIPLEKVWSAVQVLAEESETPPPPPTQVPSGIWKQPALKLTPLAKVEEAVVPVKFKLVV